MSAQGWQETLVVATGDGPALNTFAAATTLLPTPAISTLPANYFDKIGKMLRMKAIGRIASFTSGTFTCNAALGTLASPISIWTPGAITTVVALPNQT